MPRILSFPTVKPWIHSNYTSYHAAVSSSYVGDDSNPQSLIHEAYPELQTSTTTTQGPTITSSYSRVKSTSSFISTNITPTRIITTPALATTSSFSSSTSTSSTTTKIAVTSYAVVWIPGPDSISSQNVPLTSLSTTQNSQAASPLATSSVYLLSRSTVTTITTTPPTHAPSTAAVTPSHIIFPVAATPSTRDSLTISPSAEPDPMSHTGTNPCTSSSSSFLTSHPILLVLVTSYLAISSTIGFIRVCMRKLYPETYPRVGPQGEMSDREVRKLFWEGFLWPVWPCVLVWKGMWGRIEFKSGSNSSLEKRKGKGKGKEICV